MINKNSSSVISSPKRSRKERSGVHSWFPYYAGYSESFVESGIDYLKLKPGDLLLDPWSGSGTTNLIGRNKKLMCIGFDINPVMNIFSSAKNDIILHYQKIVKDLAHEVVSLSESSLKKSISNTSLLEYLPKNLCNLSIKYNESILDIKYPKLKINDSICSVLNGKFNENPIQSFLQASLLIVLKKSGNYVAGSNPTWLKKATTQNNVSTSNFKKLYLEQVDSMLADLNESKLIKNNVISSLSLEGDSRKLPIKSKCIDGIITSPPYLTRVDYAMATLPEYLLLKNGDPIRTLRVNSIGAPIIYDKKITIDPKWGPSCNKILHDIFNHESKAARSYYFPNMLQYFRDIHLSLNEIVRVLKPGKQALVVVQSSFFKEIEIDLGKIYVEMFKKMHIKSTIINREVVKGHMAHVNTKSNSYKPNKIFYEDVIVAKV